VKAVEASGVPIEYVVFPDEGHGFTRKKNQAAGCRAMLDFLDKHLKGEKPAATSHRRASHYDVNTYL
jgi:dipeptidyl aminopeptidase/acylaminoacyl peptidase